MISGVGRIDLRGDIVWDPKTFQTIEPTIERGDRVSWHEREGWQYGEALAVERDPASEQTWVWIKQDCRWPRLTMSAKDLKRIDPEKAAS